MYSFQDWELKFARLLVVWHEYHFHLACDIQHLKLRVEFYGTSQSNAFLVPHGIARSRHVLFVQLLIRINHTVTKIYLFRTVTGHHDSVHIFSACVRCWQENHLIVWFHQFGSFPASLQSRLSSSQRDSAAADRNLRSPPAEDTKMSNSDSTFLSPGCWTNHSARSLAHARVRSPALAAGLRLWTGRECRRWTTCEDRRCNGRRLLEEQPKG